MECAGNICRFFSVSSKFRQNRFVSSLGRATLPLALRLIVYAVCDGLLRLRTAQGTYTFSENFPLSIEVDASFNFPDESTKPSQKRLF